MLDCWEGWGNCSVILNRWGKVLSSGRVNLSLTARPSAPSLLLLASTALEVSALRCRTQQPHYFLGNTSRNKADVTPDSIRDLRRSSEKLSCLSVSQGQNKNYKRIIIKYNNKKLVFLSENNHLEQKKQSLVINTQKDNITNTIYYMVNILLTPIKM